jgi:hypothetical protein
MRRPRRATFFSLNLRAFPQWQQDLYEIIANHAGIQGGFIALKGVVLDGEQSARFLVHLVHNPGKLLDPRRRDLLQIQASQGIHWFHAQA